MQLETRVAEDFGYRKPTFSQKCEEAFPGSKRGQWKWSKINWSVSGNDLLSILAAYACEDAYWETKMYYHYRPKLDGDAMWVLENIEMPLVNILRDMKIRGVLIDVPFLRSLGEVVDVKLAELREAIYAEAGCVFNLQSSPQKQNILYDKMGLPVLKATKSGGRSTDSDVMEMLADKGYKIAEYFVKYSEIQKLNSGYIQSIPALVDRHNVLRGDLNSNGTKTGRFSSQNPNLQNQPNNHDFPIRRAFIPRPGMVFLNYDYSQLELRVMAHVSQDKHFLEVFRNGEDPHGDVARRLGIPRRGAKVVNFGVLYGMGSEKLAKTINVSTKEADKIINVDYLRTYAGFAAWKVQTENFVKRHGFVKNIFGRIRRLPNATKGPLERTPKEFYGALRQSINSPIQGSGADMVKLAMIKMATRFKEEGIDAHLVLQVHDEVLVEVSIPDMYRAQEIVIDSMENAVKLSVPMLVDGKIITNWAEMKDDDTPSFPLRFDYSLYATLL